MARFRLRQGGAVVVTHHGCVPQDRARVAGGRDYEVRYEAKKTSRSKAAVKKAVKKVGTSRRRVERALGR
jgi:Protein of unknown function (DUF3606)